MGEYKNFMRQLRGIAAHGPLDKHDSDVVERAADELERLQKIVARIQKTKDGVPILGGDTLYFVHPVTGVMLDFYVPPGALKIEFVLHGLAGDEVLCTDCSSTPEAAREAAEEAAKKGSSNE